MLARTVVFIASIFALSSCSSEEGGGYDFVNNPLQVVYDMHVIQSENGKVTMRMEAPRMERFENDSCTLEKFPEGMKVYSYNEEGLLEATIVSNEARHRTPKRARFGEELWMAFGDVVIHNTVKDETMETDTIYWDRTMGRIYSDSYVRMYSPDGFMQGYGMQTDDKARESTILNPFNSYGVVVKDTTEVIVDTANFIGPFRENSTMN